MIQRLLGGSSCQTSAELLFCSSAVVLSVLLFQMVADLETLSRKTVEHVAALTSTFANWLSFL